MPAILVIAIGVVSAVVLSQNARRRHEPAEGQGVRAAVRLAVRVPGDDGAQVDELVLPRRPRRQVRAGVGGRDPLVLDPGDGAEAGRRARHRRRTSCHADAHRARSRSICTELCGLGHATMRAPVRVSRAGRLRAPGSSRSSRRPAGGEAAGGGEAGGARSSADASPTPAAAAATRSTPPAPTRRSGPTLDDLAAARRAGRRARWRVRPRVDRRPERGPRRRATSDGRDAEGLRQSRLTPDGARRARHAT